MQRAMQAAGTADARSGKKLEIFISYSRQDMHAADVLVADLEAQGFGVSIDRRDLPFGEQWQTVLTEFIVAADAVIWLVSPHSIGSRWCLWELGEVERLGKRLVPVRLGAVDSTDLPSAIGRVHILPIDGLYERDRDLGPLVTALATDRQWIQEHTRLGALALRWHHSERPRHELLQGAAVDAAEQWLRFRPATAPEATAITGAYIQASRQEATVAAKRRKRTIVAIAGLSLAVVGVAGLAYVGYLDATYLEGRFNRLRNQWTDSGLKPGDVTRDCWSDACPEMVVVPAGTFVMGSPADETDRVRDEGPQHAVTIARPFLVGKFEVTFDEWDACYAAGGCRKWPDSEWGRGKRPVVNVAWNDVQPYLAWLSAKTGLAYRLLTEAQWEYAARGVSSAEVDYSAYPWGKSFRPGLAHCLVCSDQPAQRTMPVGSFPPNPFGLHDMLGNVYEWVRDCYVDDYTNAPADGSAAPEKANCMRVARGGAFGTGPKYIRPAYRNRQLPGQAYRNFGFRVARDLTPAR